MKAYLLVFVTTILSTAFPTASAQTLISHTKALAGGISPGDAPGYPIQITARGSYKLTGNLHVPALTVGISINAPNVTLDLNGFTIFGGGSCSQDPQKVVTCTQGILDTHIGVLISADQSIVRNGYIKGFTGNGMRLSRGATLQDLEIAENSGHGIETAWGNYGIMRMTSVHIHRNRHDGANIDTDAIIERSRIERNGEDGLDVAFGQRNILVVDSVIANNRNTGMENVTARSTISSNNGTNVMNVISLGANLNGQTPY